MEIHFVHHPVTLWHPAMVIAVTGTGLLAWYLNRVVTQLALSLRRRSHRLLSILIAVPLLAAVVAILTFIVFALVWDQVEGRNVHVGFGYFNRFALLLPVLTGLVSVTLEVVRREASVASAV